MSWRPRSLLTVNTVPRLLPKINAVITGRYANNNSLLCCSVIVNSTIITAKSKLQKYLAFLFSIYISIKIHRRQFTRQVAVAKYKKVFIAKQDFYFFGFLLLPDDTHASTRSITENRKHSNVTQHIQGGPKKLCQIFLSCNNFGKYGPILIMFSLLHSQMNWKKARIKSTTSPQICCCTTLWKLNVQLYSYWWTKTATFRRSWFTSRMYH